MLNVTKKVKTDMNKYFKKRENYGKLPLKNKKGFTLCRNIRKQNE